MDFEYIEKSYIWPERENRDIQAGIVHLSARSQSHTYDMEGFACIFKFPSRGIEREEIYCRVETNRRRAAIWEPDAYCGYIRTQRYDYQQRKKS